MNPTVKRIIGAIAVKEVIDRIQEARKPKKGLFSRTGSLVVPAAIAGGIYYLHKTGKLEPLIEQGKALLSQGQDAAYTPPAPSASTL